MNNKPIIKTIWGAYETIDDRGSLGRCLGYFSAEIAAIAAIKKKGWYGGDGVTQELSAITVDGKTYLLAERNPIKVDSSKEEVDALRKSALAKLLPKERKALGY